MESFKMYSADGETYIGDRKTAISDLDLQLPGECAELYVADPKTYKMGDFITQFIVHDIAHKAAYTAGAASEDWVANLDEAEILKVLKETLNKYADEKGIQPTFYSVVNETTELVKYKG